MFNAVRMSDGKKVDHLVKVTPSSEIPAPVAGPLGQQG
jgi:hypothetical protein